MKPTPRTFALLEEFPVKLVVRTTPTRLNGQSLRVGQQVALKAGDLLEPGTEELALARQRNLPEAG